MKSQISWARDRVNCQPASCQVICKALVVTEQQELARIWARQVFNFIIQRWKPIDHLFKLQLDKQRILQRNIDLMST
jgi:hypothetical protein